MKMKKNDFILIQIKKADIFFEYYFVNNEAKLKPRKSFVRRTSYKTRSDITSNSSENIIHFIEGLYLIPKGVIEILNYSLPKNPTSSSK